MRKLCLVVAVLLLLPSAYLMSQEWSAAQKEVWKLEEGFAAAFEKGDLEAVLSYMHPDYRGSGHGSAVPIDKVIFRKNLESFFKNYKVTNFFLQPTAIQIYGNTAIIHYIATTSMKSLEGKEIESQFAYTDIYVKQGDKWLCVADNGNELKR